MGARGGGGLRRRLRPPATGRPRAAAGPAPRRLADQQPLLRRRRGERHHRLPPGRLRPAGARPGGRGRAQLLLLEPDLGRRRRAYDLGHAAALVGAYEAVAPLSRAERAAFADVLGPASSSTGSRSSTTTGASSATARRPTGPGRRSCSATPAGGSQSRAAMRMPPSRGSPAPAEQPPQERPRLHQRLLDLLAGVGVPHDPAAHPEVDLAARDREGTDREAQVEVAVGVDAADARPSRRRGRRARAGRCARSPPASVRP